MSNTETNMDLVEPYSTGSIRACGLCDHQVIWTGYNWAHLPKNGYFESPDHEAYPFPEHKHKYKITGADGIVYTYKCSVCLYESETSVKLVRYLLTGKWENTKW